MSSAIVPPDHPNSINTEVNSNGQRNATKEGPCVLVIDDDFKTRQSLRKQLQAAGFQVCTATDGIEALSILDYQDIDVVRLDVRMPCMDGFEVWRTIKRTSRYCSGS